MRTQKLLIAGAAAILSIAANAATINYDAGNLLFAEHTPWGDIEIAFSKCMANELYTFSSVTLDGVEVNHTSSDNIGPFLVDQKGWAGGNHLNGERRSAFTESVTIAVDGTTLTADTTVNGNVMTVVVTNRLLDPVDDSDFAIERMIYTVSGNSIEVNAAHEFLNASPEMIERYYGMQSMFKDETELLTPGGEFCIWTSFKPENTGHELQFTKASAPSFCTFIEHSPHGYQAAYMLREGIGERNFVRDDDIVFIGNSWSKSYHKTLGMHPVKKGDRINWHGIYSWFNHPVNDRCRPGDEACPTFDYGAYIGGKPQLFHIHPDGALTSTPL